MPQRSSRWRLALSAVAVAIGITLAAQDNDRDLARLSESLQLRLGSVVADIGAGSEGLLTIPVARRVGPTGRVYATELGERPLEQLREAVKKAAVANIEILAGDLSHTNLPDACCDAIFIRYVYHHFADPPAMNASLRQSLKPGGVLAIIEFAPQGPEASSTADRAADKTHGVGADSVARELQQAGFELISSDQKSDRDVFVVVRKPK
jgi:ubiquinone/menaquinone biosynthesis C-methylase UbiE